MHALRIRGSFQMIMIDVLKEAKRTVNEIELSGKRHCPKGQGAVLKRSVPDYRARLSQSTIPALPSVSSSPMSSFYHEPVPPNLSPGPYPHPHPAQLADVRPDHVHPHGGLYKPCSVKGCSNFVPLEHPHKMCEVCRGRHRVYAMTKRAKRKKEKAVLTGSASQHQSVAWMPPEENLLAQEADFGQSSTQGAREEFAQPLPGDQHIFEVMHCYPCMKLLL